MQPKEYDIAIIGGGVVGSAIARELAKYRVKTAVFEKEADVGQGASSSNSGVVHAGFTCGVGTLKAELCMRGNSQFESMCGELGVPYKKIGKYVVAVEKNQIPELYHLKQTGEQNGVELFIIGEEEINKNEPGIRGKAALYSPNSAITSPYGFTIALAENAHQNGVDFFLETRVEGIESRGDSFILTTEKGTFKTSYVVNAAGVYSDEIARMSGERKYTIYPCRGEYYVLDKDKGYMTSKLIYPVPTGNSGGLGIHLTPTVNRNIMIGPSNEYIKDKDDRANTTEVMHRLLKEAQEFLPRISARDIIKCYAGIRSKIVPPEIGGFTDFVIKPSKAYVNFINLIGIESPGLTAAPGIAEYVVNIINGRENLKENPDFNGKRKQKPIFNTLSEEEKHDLYRGNPDYGDIVCRCENITRQEIIDAINNPLKVKTLKGIKYRTGATMGRCQGGYCITKIVRIMKEEFGIRPTELTLSGGQSKLFAGQVRERI